MLWFVVILAVLGSAGAVFGVWPVVGVCLLVWFALAVARVLHG